MSGYKKLERFISGILFGLIWNALGLPREAVRGHSEIKRASTWSSLVDQDKGAYLLNWKTNFDIVLQGLSLYLFWHCQGLSLYLFWHFLSTTAYQLGWCEPSSPPIKELYFLNTISYIWWPIFYWFIFLIGQTRPLLFFRPFLNTMTNITQNLTIPKWNNHRWCAWVSNSEPHDGWQSRIQFAMAAVTIWFIF